MKSGEYIKAEIGSTSGLVSSNQLVSMTNVPVVSGVSDLTAVPGITRIVLIPRPPRRAAVKEPPTLSEASWKRLAAKARQDVKRKGLRPAAVNKAIRSSRYSR